MSPCRRWSKLYDVYSFKVLPWLGQQVAQAIAILPVSAESIRKFLTQDNLAGMMSEAGPSGT